MINNHSTDGHLEDVIRAINHLGCAEEHMRTLIKKTESELENGMTDMPEQSVNKLVSLQDELEEVTAARRKLMLYLYENGNGDKDYWCLVKHLGIASTCIFEGTQADASPELAEILSMVEKNRTKILTHFLGYELTDCASCFSDMLKGGNNGE